MAPSKRSVSETKSTNSFKKTKKSSTPRKNASKTVLRQVNKNERRPIKEKKNNTENSTFTTNKKKRRNTGVSKKTATFKTEGQPRRISDVKTVGKINRNEEFDLGILVEKPDKKTNIVIFKFQRNRVKYNALSFKENINTNFEKFNKLGHSYVVKGSIVVRCVRKEYQKNFTHELILNEVDVVSMRMEKVPRKTFSNLATLMKRGSNFEEKDVKMELVSGEVYRYMGCNKCTKSIPRPIKGSYSCPNENCDRFNEPQERKLCIIIRNLKVKDPVSKEKLSPLVVYHRHCKRLFGTNLFNKIVGAFEDGTATQALKLLIEKKINLTGTLKYEKKKEKAFPTTIILLNIVKNSFAITLEEDDDDDIGVEPMNIDDNGCKSGQDAKNEDIADVFVNSKKKRKQRKLLEFEYYDLEPTTDGYTGLAMVININIGTEESDQALRKGSEQDVAILEKILPQRGIAIYKGKTLRNLKAQEFQDELVAFKWELVSGGYPSCFLIFMGHGVDNRIKFADGSRQNIYTDVMEKFSENNFMAFAGNPKIFIFQACRNVYSFSVVDPTQEFSLATSSPMANMLWCNACMPGQPALRHVELGSLLIQTLAKCLDKFKNEDLMQILSRVQMMLKQEQANDGYYIPTITVRCFLKYKFSK